MFGSHKLQQLEWQHEERMKALEQGHPLPDAELAWARAAEQRSNQLTTFMLMGTFCLTGAPVGATAIILAQGQTLPAVGIALVLAVIWCACAFVLLCLIRHVMAALAQIRRTQPDGRSPKVGSQSLSGLKLVPEEEAPHKSATDAFQARL